MLKPLRGIIVVALAMAAHAETPAKQLLGTPFLEEEFWAPALRYRTQPLHGLLNLDFSDHYITSRGLNVENQGLIFQPTLLLYADLYADRDGFLNDVTLTAGIWNSYHTRRSGVNPNNWNETDSITGLTLTFAKHWKLSAIYSGYFTQTNSFETAWNLDLTLGCDDSAWLGRFALHPYVQYSRETEGKTTVVFRPDRTDESWSLQFGINPGYQFQSLPVKVEFPTFLTYVPNGFYQRSTTELKAFRFSGVDHFFPVYDGRGGGAGVGFFSTSMKVSVPLNFIPKDRGQWTVYATAQYYRMNNAGLLDGNQVLGACGQRERNIVQFHCGLSIGF